MNRKNLIKRVTTIFISGLISMFLLEGCTHMERPVLYPNQKVTTSTKALVERDIDECMRLGKEYVKGYSRTGEVALRTTRNAAIAAATGAAISAVGGGNAGTGAAIGAAGAGTATIAREVANSGKPDPMFKNFVEKCLRDKGYEVMGWR